MSLTSKPTETAMPDKTLTGGMTTDELGAYWAKQLELGESNYIKISLAGGFVGDGPRHIHAGYSKELLKRMRERPDVARTIMQAAIATLAEHMVLEDWENMPPSDPPCD